MHLRYLGRAGGWHTPYSAGARSRRPRQPVPGRRRDRDAAEPAAATIGGRGPTRAVSFWLETAGDDLTPRPPLDGSTDADVAILGAGLTGPVDRVLPRAAATRRCGS